MNEVRIYKPFNKTAKWASWTKNYQENWTKWTGLDPEKLVLDHVISSEDLVKRGEEIIKKISTGKDRQFNGWRRMDDRALVKCLWCLKITKNENVNGEKYFCTPRGGVNYRYWENKLILEGKIEKNGRQKKK